MKVIAPKQDIAIVENRVKVDLALEDAASLLSNYRINRTLPGASCFRYADVAMVIDLPDGKTAVSLPCGFSNNQIALLNPASWKYFIMGSGFRITRLFSYLFVKDHKQLNNFERDVAKIPNLVCLIPLHGPPIYDLSGAAKYLLEGRH